MFSRFLGVGPERRTDEKQEPRTVENKSKDEEA